MIEAVASLMSQGPLPQSLQARQVAEAPQVAQTERPTDDMAADFSQRVAKPTQANNPERPAILPERIVDATKPTGETDVAKRIEHQANSLADYLRSVDPRSNSHVPEGVPPEGSFSAHDGSRSTIRPSGKDANEKRITEADRAAVDANIAQMENAYVFAIEATLASHGSTEVTKIFNTLLRGQ